MLCVLCTEFLKWSKLEKRKHYYENKRKYVYSIILYLPKKKSVFKCIYAVQTCVVHLSYVYSLT